MALLSVDLSNLESLIWWRMQLWLGINRAQALSWSGPLNSFPQFFVWFGSACGTGSTFVFRVSIARSGLLGSSVTRRADDSG